MKKIKTFNPFPTIKRKQDNSFYKTARWLKLRKRFLGANPCCSTCGGVENMHVHHVKDRRDFPRLAYAWSNLESQCRRCHAKITFGRNRS